MAKKTASYFLFLLAVFLAVAILWPLASFLVGWLYLEASDPPNPDLSGDPWLLRALLNGLLFPINHVPLGKTIFQFGASTAVGILITGIIANGVFWAAAITSLAAWMIHLRRARGRLDQGVLSRS
jgi:hypothetical protein